MQVFFRYTRRNSSKLFLPSKWVLLKPFPSRVPELCIAAEQALTNWRIDQLTDFQTLRYAQICGQWVMLSWRDTSSFFPHFLTYVATTKYSFDDSTHLTFFEIRLEMPGSEFSYVWNPNDSLKLGVLQSCHNIESLSLYVNNDDSVISVTAFARDGIYSSDQRKSPHSRSPAITQPPRESSFADARRRPRRLLAAHQSDAQSNPIPLL